MLLDSSLDTSSLPHTSTCVAVQVVQLVSTIRATSLFVGLEDLTAKLTDVSNVGTVIDTLEIPYASTTLCKSVLSVITVFKGRCELDVLDSHCSVLQKKKEDSPD